MVLQVIENTGQNPYNVSADAGYSSLSQALLLNIFFNNIQGYCEWIKGMRR